MKSNIINKICLSIFLILLFGQTSMAQQIPVNSDTTSGSSMNLLEVVLIVVATILAFVIWGLGQALSSVSKIVRDKQKKAENNLLNVIILIVSAFLPATTFAQDQTVAAPVASSINYGGLSESGFYMLILVLLMELILIFFLSFMIKRMYVEMLPEQQVAVKSTSKLLEWWSKMDQKFFTKAIPVEKEADLMLDHDYDGIKELDNALPPWWKYGFYITIFVGVIYLFNFHVLGYGKNPTQEYQAEMEKALAAKEAYEAMNKDKIDEDNVPMADAAGIAAGKEIFNSPSMCWTCHGKLGEGGAGPNLTDDYWIHKGSLNDIYQSIKHGYPDKGMQAWDSKFTPKEISLLASYIKSLRGTNPPGAIPPKGELYTEESTAPMQDTTANISTKLKGDTTKVKP